MSSQDLTTEEGVLRYLCKRFYPTCSKVERLSDGFSGFVYRANLASTKQSTSIIVKHFESYAARAPTWKLDPVRLNFESKMLNLFSQLDWQGDSIVHVPKILQRDEERHVLVLEDAGPLPSLKLWFTAVVDASTCVAIGSALGAFLAKFHNSTAGQRELMSGFTDNATAKNLSSTLYFGRLPGAAAEFGFTDDCFKEAAKVGEREVWQSEDVLTLGDFWTGNILVSTQPELRLFALDFELAKPGTAAFDVGQMAAEMYCLAAFKDHHKGLVMLEAFLEAYMKGREGESSVDATKVAVRIGAHLLVVMPRAWNNEVDDGRICEVVKVGAELVRIGWEGNLEKLGTSIVRPLLNLRKNG
ncbi:MAG: hypothetical protein M1821_001626 [Bathelium mastoideum]|nr:MAG: hypothetical protein M1821_001626 [Bathelium mastoideum]